MSFLDCIGYIMEGTGLAEVIEQVYAGNTEQHILSGKAVSRAMRAHSFADMAFIVILLSTVYDVSGEDTETNESRPEVFEDIRKLYEEMLLNGVSCSDVASHGSLQQILTACNDQKKRLSGSRTVGLWLQYMQMIATWKRFIVAERTGDFQLHLKTVYRHATILFCIKT